MQPVRKSCCRRRGRHGISTVWVAVTGFVMLALLGLGADTAYVYLVAHQLQNAADAAAMAAANKLRSGTAANARAQAIAIAQANKANNAAILLADNPGNLAGGDIVIGTFDRNANPFPVHVTPTTTNPNAVEILARRTTGSPGGALPLVFGRIFGFNTSNVSRSAIAVVSGQLTAGIIVLDPTRSGALTISGSSTLNVPNGAIQVNSNSSTAVDLGSNPILNITEMRITGGINTNVVVPNLHTGVTPVPDPLAAVPAPTKGPDLGSISVSGNKVMTKDPGYYSGGIQVTGGTLTLNPGVYILGPQGLKITGGILNADGVMFYVTTGSGSSYGIVSISGSPTIHISAPTSGIYKGISMFMDRTAANLSKNASNINGTSATYIAGTLYFPSTDLTISGTSDNLGNQVIAGTLKLGGSGVLTVQYDGRNPINVGGSAFLVK